MTPWHYRWLCQFSYIDLPGDSATRHGQSLGALAKELLRLDAAGSLACGRLSDGDREALNVILGTEPLAGLELVDFINRNEGSGFVAYAFRDKKGGMHCIFRGSETRGCGVPSGIDWLDNFLSPFVGSVQYREIGAFAKRFGDKRVVFSGHSKGAHNALYALAVHPGGDAEAIAFNGQGFAPGQLAKAQRARLAKQGINYVVRGDIVGSLLWHPEKRIFVQKKGTGDAHALSGFAFDGGGEPIPAMRPVWSMAVEWGTRLCLHGVRRARGMRLA